MALICRDYGRSLPAALAAPRGRKPIAASGPKVTLNAVDEGAAAKSAAQSLRVYLAPNGGENALKQAVPDVSTPGSATHGQYLTPDQFRARYEPTGATVEAVKLWLKFEGLKPTGAEAAGRYITATGTAAAAEAAFATALREFTGGGETFQAPTATPTVPNSFDPSGGFLHSIRTFDQDSSLTVTPGWDDVTGIGSPSPKYITAFNAAG